MDGTIPGGSELGPNGAGVGPLGDGEGAPIGGALGAGTVVGGGLGAGTVVGGGLGAGTVVGGALGAGTVVGGALGAGPGVGDNFLNSMSKNIVDVSLVGVIATGNGIIDPGLVGGPPNPSTGVTYTADTPTAVT